MKATLGGLLFLNAIYADITMQTIYSSNSCSDNANYITTTNGVCQTNSTCSVLNSNSNYSLTTICLKTTDEVFPKVKEIGIDRFAYIQSFSNEKCTGESEYSIFRLNKCMKRQATDGDEYAILECKNGQVISQHFKSSDCSGDPTTTKSIEGGQCTQSKIFGCSDSTPSSSNSIHNGHVIALIISLIMVLM
jgi:hypothetical protein